MSELNQAELREIALLRQKTTEMLEQVQAMFRTSFDGLMKNDIDTLNQVLEDEEKITGIYNSLTASAVESSKKNLLDEAKRIVVDLMDITCAIERIGDCCVDLVERIEYKIRENLLFSEAAVQEYKDLYSKVDQILSDTIKVMKNKDKKLAEKILENKPALDLLVDKYRASHIDRSAKGICDEWARVRYLDMLDLTKEAAHYCMRIVGKLVEE